MSTDPAPSPENVKTAIEALRTELSHALDDSNALDQKALLIPGFTAALATFFLAPIGPNAGTLQLILAIASIAAAALTVILGFATLRPTDTHLGPNADQVAAGLSIAPDDFELRVLGSMVNEVNEQTRANITKSNTLWNAMRLAAVTAILVLATRVAGGI